MEAPTILHAVLPNIPPYVSYSWLAMGILIGTALAVKNRLSLVPSGLQNLMEVFADLFLNLTNSNIGHHWGEKFYPLIGTIGMYILTCNFMGLIPGFDAPTSNINMTASIAVPVFFIYQYYGIKVHGVKYLNHFLGPIRSIYALPLMIMMFFIELIGHLVRPITLSVRLFGNMMAKHMILLILGVLAPVIVPVAILGLGVLVSIIQAYVFALLATLYIAGAVEEGH
ncbi:MAG: F0F1 ATP synthase subunit A [Nitrospirae bacterium]|nr:F0F1 ATP synthase subunit A [Nitrospirota bacterium]MDA8215063.1 F0F1 ATP synthase subunit A [Nitrospiraceae bacterium]MDA8339572.1 F0F1 ATP synthase subunit A [Nitrospiraceae bacterium]